MEEERTATIERDNRILLEKMSHIMRTTGSVNNRNDYEPKRYEENDRNISIFVFLLVLIKENVERNYCVFQKKMQHWQKES